MTQAVLAAVRPAFMRVVAPVSAAHFMSHYYSLLLAPLLPFVRADYDVSYTEIGLALAAFNLVSAVLQTPAGFLVDRLGARALLIIGLIVGAGAFILAGAMHSFWVLIAMFALAGVGNTVYHPADYALLSQHVPARQIGQAFSLHTFAGMLGSALAPPTLLLLYQGWGWRAAFIATGLFGLAIAAVIAAISEPPAVVPHASANTAQTESATDWSVLLSMPILLSLAFFTLVAVSTAGFYTYSVVALVSLYGTAIATANAGLTAFLLASCAGVLAGGWLVGRTNRHAFVASCGLAVAAAFILLVAATDLGSVGLVTALSLAGFFSGVIMPSRDMIVRAVTPPGSFGKVFGFVTTGFSIGGIVAPLVFGPIMDHGSPRLVFVIVGALFLLSIATVASRTPA